MNVGMGSPCNKRTFSDLYDKRLWPSIVPRSAFITDGITGSDARTLLLGQSPLALRNE